MDCSLQAPPSLGFSRQEHWSGVAISFSRASLTKDLQNLSGAGPTPVSQSHKSHASKCFLCICWNRLPKLTNSIWVYVMNSVTLGSLDDAPLLGLRLLMLHFLLHSGPRCLAGTHGLITFIISHLPPRCQRCWVLQGHGVLALTPIYAALVLPRVSAHCTPAWHHREHYQYSPSGQSGKHTPRCQAVPATLFGKWELTACNPFSILSSEPSITSQSSNWSPCQENRGHQYHMLSGGHWLPPSSGASDSPTCWISCQLCQLYRWSSCLWHQLSCCIPLWTLFFEPRGGKLWAKRLEGDLRGQGTAGTFILCWLAQQL